MKKYFLIVLIALCAVAALAPISVYAVKTCNYSLAISPDPIAFGSQNPTTPKKLTVKITNTSVEVGGPCGDIAGITLGETGDTSNVFAIDSDNCDTLSRGASCTADVIFTPAAEGATTATFTLDSTSPVLSYTAALSGTGLIGAGLTDSSAALLVISQLNKDDSSGCSANAATGTAGKKSFGPAALGFIAVMGLVLGTVAIRRRIRKF